MSLVCRAQERKQIIILYPNTDYIQEIYDVQAGSEYIREGDYFSFYERALEKTKWKNEKTDADKLRGLKTRGFYRNNLKDSVWTVYDKPTVEPFTYNDIKEEGWYINDKKAGVWYTFFEQGKVIKQYDFDEKKELTPLFKARFAYPSKAKAARTEGIVAVKIVYQKCVVKKYEIIKDIGNGCGQSVVNGLKEILRLKAKYGINPVDCTKKDSIVTTRFRL